jgi:hypothetical protein
MSAIEAGKHLHDACENDWVDEVANVLSVYPEVVDFIDDEKVRYRERKELNCILNIKKELHIFDLYAVRWIHSNNLGCKEWKCAHY